MKSRIEMIVNDAKKLLKEDSSAVIKFSLDEREFERFSRLSLFFEGYEILKEVEIDLVGNDKIYRDYSITIRKKARNSQSLSQSLKLNQYGVWKCQNVFIAERCMSLQKD